jgi:hypothetical protein
MVDAAGLAIRGALARLLRLGMLALGNGGFHLAGFLARNGE